MTGDVCSQALSTGMETLCPVWVRGGGSARGEGGVVDEGVQGGGGVEEPGSWGANSLVSDDLGGTLAAAGRSGDRARSS